MSKYKRLTQWTENGASLDLGNPKSDMEARKALMEQFKKACNKLAELEDKLEVGRLVEVPETKIDIDPFGGGWYIVYHKVLTEAEWNFNTREAAEARLKELEKKLNELSEGKQ